MNENQPTLKDPKIRRVYEYWLARCRDGKLPARSDIEPIDLSDALPHLILADDNHAPFEMRYPPFGTRPRPLRRIPPGRVVSPHATASDDEDA